MTRKTSVIGFPRIGKNRELKFASEKYFKKEISADELEKTAIVKYGEGIATNTLFTKIVNFITFK